MKSIRKDTPRPTILFVGDNPQTAFYIAAAEQQGFEAIAIDNGEEALDCLARRDITSLVVNSHLRLRAKDKEVSETGGATFLERAREAGYLAKVTRICANEPNAMSSFKAAASACNGQWGGRFIPHQNTNASMIKSAIHDVKDMVSQKPHGWKERTATSQNGSGWDTGTP